MKLRECLDIDNRTIERIKATTTFFPASDDCKEDRNQVIPPFEKAVIEHIIRRQKSENTRYRSYPSLAQVLLNQTGGGDSQGKSSGGRRQSDQSLLASRGISCLIQGLLSLKVGVIDFWETGESESPRSFHQLATACIKSGFDLGLLTNAAWSDKHTTDLVVDDFSFLRINLDASNDQVYNRIHRPVKSHMFQRVIKNIERIIHERDIKKSQMVVGAEAQLTQANMNFAEEITGLARDLGMDYIQLRIGRSGHALLPDQIETVRRLTEELKSVFHPFPVYAQVEALQRNPRCRVAQFQLVIDEFGDIYPCLCFHKQPRSRSFGNIFDQPVEKLWHNPQHRQLMDSLQRNGCKLNDCRWYSCNSLLDLS